MTISREVLYVSDMGALREAWGDDVNLTRMVELLERHRPDEMQKDLRGFEWYYYWQLSRRGVTAPTFQHNAAVYQAVFSSDGNRLATVGLDDAVTLWDLTASARKSRFATDTGHVYSMAFSPDGAALASASHDWTVRLWDVAKHEVRANFKEHQTQVGHVAFSPDGHTLMSCTRDGEIMLRRAATQAEVEAAGW